MSRTNGENHGVEPDLGVVPKDVFDSTRGRDHEAAYTHATPGAKEDNKQRHAQLGGDFLQPIAPEATCACTFAKLGIDFFRVQQYGQFDLAERVGMFAL